MDDPTYLKRTFFMTSNSNLTITIYFFENIHTKKEKCNKKKVKFYERRILIIWVLILYACNIDL